MTSTDPPPALDLRVGTVLRAEPNDKARKPSYKLWIDFGPLGEKQSSAQLTELYACDDLVGRQVIAAMNLGTRNIAGFESEVLVLGIPDTEGRVVLLSVERQVPNGGQVYCKDLPMRGLRLELPLHMAAIEFASVRVTDADTGHAALTACARAIAARYSPDGTGAPGAVEGVDHARRIFRALGIDPTRRRPSSESLLRRALRHQEMPHINDLVDVLNWCSLDVLLPLGLYDAAKITGDVVLSTGGPGDVYEAISNRELNLDGRSLLADDLGAFGSPMTDSKRTCVTTDTTRCAIYVYAPEDYDVAQLEAHARTMIERVKAHCAGSGAEMMVV